MKLPNVPWKNIAAIGARAGQIRVMPFGQNALKIGSEQAE
jgi:hypothetical protein